MNRILIKILAIFALVTGLASCSVYKYVPEGHYLLSKVDVTSDDKSVSVLYDAQKLSRKRHRNRNY